MRGNEENLKMQIKKKEEESKLAQEAADAEFQRKLNQNQNESAQQVAQKEAEITQLKSQLEQQKSKLQAEINDKEAIQLQINEQK